MGRRWKARLGRVGGVTDKARTMRYYPVSMGERQRPLPHARASGDDYGARKSRGSLLRHIQVLSTTIKYDVAFFLTRAGAVVIHLRPGPMESLPRALDSLALVGCCPTRPETSDARIASWENFQLTSEQGIGGCIRQLYQSPITKFCRSKFSETVPSSGPSYGRRTCA